MVLSVILIYNDFLLIKAGRSPDASTSLQQLNIEQALTDYNVVRYSLPCRYSFRSLRFIKHNILKYNMNVIISDYRFIIVVIFLGYHFMTKIHIFYNINYLYDYKSFKKFQTFSWQLLLKVGVHFFSCELFFLEISNKTSTYYTQ